MLRSVAIAILGFVSLSANTLGDVPPDLVQAVRFQQKNKGAMIKRLQQRAGTLRQQGDAQAAKEMKAVADAVRANKLLILPPFGEVSQDIGTIDIERVLEKTDDGVNIETSLPRVENTSVNTVTGDRGSSPFGMNVVYYPEKLHVASTRVINAGQTINVRRTANGLAEIPQQEMESASALLKAD